MRLTGSRAYYRSSPPKMPPGLVDLMEGLTKEVLKHNPSDVYGFCAGHMQQLLDKRDGPSFKKSLPLEEKIAKAQGKVRQRAQNRRQEYVKNVVLQQQNNNAKNNVVKEDLTLQVPKDVNIILGKDNITLLVRDQVAQNIVNTPIHQEQALNDSGEMEISHDTGSSVSKSRDDVDENKDNEESGEKVHESETVNVQVTEKCQSVTETEFNEQNVNVISSNMKPDIETVNKDLIDNNISDKSKLLNATHQLNENRANNFVNNKEQAEVVLKKLELAEIESNKSLTLNGVDSIPKYSDKVENIADVINSEQEILNEVVQIRDNLSESCNDEQVKLENFNNNEKVTIYHVQLPSNMIDIYDSNSPHDTDTNARRLQHIEDVQLSTHIEDVQQSNGAKNSLTCSDVLRTDRREDEQVKTDDLRENNSEISRELIEKDTQRKCDDDFQAFNNTTNSDNVYDKQEHIRKTIMKSTDTIEKIHVNHPEETGVDSDIQTLVTENSVKSFEVNDVGSDTSQLKSISSLDNMFDVNEEKSNLELSSAGNLRDCTKQRDKGTVESVGKVSDVIYENEAKNNDTIHTNINEKNQGTNMDLETAAITIQKVFRNFLFKSRGSTFEDTANDEGNFMEENDKNKEECNFLIANSLSTDRRAHGITRMDTVLQTVNEEKSLSLSTDDSSTLSSAATIIQAHVRGFLVRNKFNSNKTVSTTSLAASNSNEPSSTSIEAGGKQNKNVLNIHIVPEGENCLSRDESLITSMDLSLDSSPPSSINLHPLGYDKSERRKLKREDAIQSISPPSNNSGKLSEDFDSVKELPVSGQEIENHKMKPIEIALTATDLKENETVDKSDDDTHYVQNLKMKGQSLTKMNSDEMDVVTPFMSNEDLTSSNLMCSGEFHDAVLPTKVSRSDTSVVSGE